MATKPLPSKLAESYQSYPTASAAAVAALRGITNKNTETGGGILYNKEQNAYAATDPVGQGNDAHFSAAVSVPQGWQLHSTYHTHPSGPSSTMFSDDDVSMSQQLKAPSYILARDDNKIRMFDPASSKVQRDSSFGDQFAKGARYSYGTAVDESPPTPTASTTLPPPSLPAAPGAAPAAQAPAAPATTVPVTGSRIMDDFASRHRAQTTKYKSKVVHIKSGAPKRPS